MKSFSSGSDEDALEDLEGASGLWSRWTSRGFQDGDTPRPVRVQRAKLHARQNACTVWNAESQDWEFLPVWGTSAYKMGQYGVGVQLYFEFLLWMSAVFLLMSAITSPLMILNASGNRVSDMTGAALPLYSFVASLSLANLGYCPEGGCTSEAQLRERGVSRAMPDERLSDWTEWLGLLDGVASLVFVLFCLWFRACWIPRRVHKNDVRNITAADYAVQIHGLPRRLQHGHDDYEARLRKHVQAVLRRAGVADPLAIQELTLVRDYGGAILKFQNMGALLQKQESLDARMDRVTCDRSSARCARQQRTLADRAGGIERSLRGQAGLRDEDRGVCGAFVMFNESAHRVRFLNEYRLAHSYLFGRCQRRRCFEGNYLVASQAPEPNEIFWQNMDLHAWQRRLRQLMTFVLTAVLLTCASLTLVWVRSSAFDQAGMACTGEISFQVAEEAGAAAEDPAWDPTVACYCRQRRAVLGRGFAVPPYRTQAARLCSAWSTAQNTRLVQMACVVAVVIVFNKVLVVAFSHFAIWERHCKVTDLTRSQLSKLLLGQFINTGILVLLVNANFRGNMEILGDYSRFLSIGNGNYDDFREPWFVSVGSVLTLTISVHVLSTTLPSLLMSYFVRPLLAKWCYAKANTQETLNKAYQLPEWNLALRFAQTLNVIFVVMMYSGGMPALNLVGALYCFVAYWLDKRCLLRGSCRPRPYKEDIACMSLDLLPVAALLHVLMSLWVFGQQGLFPSDWSFLADVHGAIIGMTESQYEDVMAIYRDGTTAQKDEHFFEYIHARVLDMGRNGCWFLLVLLGALCAFLAARVIWALFLRPVGRPLELAAKECLRRYTRMASGLDLGRADPGKTLVRARKDRDLERAGRGVSYKLGTNWRYRDACRALGLGADFASSPSALGSARSPRGSARTPPSHLGGTSARSGAGHGAGQGGDGAEGAASLGAQPRPQLPRLLGASRSGEACLEGGGGGRAPSALGPPLPPRAEPPPAERKAAEPPPAEREPTRAGGCPLMPPLPLPPRGEPPPAERESARAGGCPAEAPRRDARPPRGARLELWAAEGAVVRRPSGPQPRSPQPRSPVPPLDMSALRGTGLWL